MAEPENAAPTGTTPSGPWSLLARGVGRNRLRIAGFVVLLTLWQLCETLVPVVIGLIIDRAVATGEPGALATWGAVLVGLFVALSFSYRFGSRLGYGAVEQEMHRLRLEIAGHVLQPRGAKNALLPGETLSLATADTENIGYSIRSLGYSVAALAALGMSSFVLLRLDLGLGLLVLIGVPVVVLALQLITPVIARRTRDQEQCVARATGVATDLVRGLRVLKGVGAEQEASRRYRLVSRDAVRAGVRGADAWAAMAGLTTLLSGLFLALVAGVAGGMALRGEITVGQLVMVVGLTQYLAEPIEVIGSLSAQTAAAHGSARRIVDFLDTPALVAAGDREPCSGHLRIDALPGIGTAASTPGELVGVAVADPTAAAGLVRDLGEGSPAISLGGEPLSLLSTPARRRWLSVSPHHVDLFEGSLRSNIDPAARLSDTDLHRLLDAAAVTDVLSQSADGIEQSISPDGATLSGGQRQRIALARALAHDAPVLVLHEPTTAVDAVTEHRIAAGIRRIRHAAGSHSTTWLVTCSPALLAQADRVVFVRDGAVVGTGTHQDLVADPGYRELVLR